MNQTRNNRGDTIWRWTLRSVGIALLIWSVVLYTITGEVPAVYPLIAAGAMGLDSIQGFEVRRRRDGNGR